MSTLNARTLIEQRTGLDVAAQLRLDPDQVLREMAGDALNYHQLLTRLAVNDELSPVWQNVIRTFAIGETYFFRDQPQFQVLRDQLLPALMAERRASGSLYLNIWSVGCATGEEPYSLAILIHELLRDAPDGDAWTIRLIGTDLNAEALEAARRGVYRPWSFRNEARPEHERGASYDRYFDVVDGGLQLKSFIREKVTFRQMNLLKGAPLPQFDIILCRHVLLYFSDERAAQVEAMLYSALKPGGWLFMGRAEALHHRSADQSPGWVTHLFPKAPVYQKPLNASASRPFSAWSTGPTITETQPAVIVEPGASLYGDLTERPTTTTTAAPFVSTPNVPDSTREVKDVFVSARQSGDAEAAERLLKARLTVSPDSALTHMLLASLYADQQRLSEAHAHLDRALSLDALLADAHTLRGLLFLEDSRHEDARTALQSALYCQRNHPLAAYTLGTLMVQLRDFSRALKLWEIARSAVAGLPPERLLSDLSDMTVGQLQMLVAAQIAAWK